MPRLRYRSGGSWADSALSGAVDFGGERIAFGPPTGGGTIDEYLDFPPPLSQSDWADQDANVGCAFAISIPGEWIGIRYWRPVTPSDTEYVFGGQKTGALLTPNTPIASGVRGAYVTQEFAAPVAITPGVDYVAAVRSNRYGFSRVTDGAVPPFTSGHIFTDSIMSAVAVYSYVPNIVPGSTSPNFHYNISPVVRFPA